MKNRKEKTMPQFDVYHAINPTFGMGTKQPSFPEEYELVAEVDGDSIDDAFRYTNHIDCPWWENWNVALVKESRSTSVGDVVVRADTGEAWLCEPTGWSSVENPGHLIDGTFPEKVT
jgi:hypothetical protein